MINAKVVLLASFFLVVFSFGTYHKLVKSELKNTSLLTAVNSATQVANEYNGRIEFSSSTVPYKNGTEDSIFVDYQYQGSKVRVQFLVDPDGKLWSYPSDRKDLVR